MLLGEENDADERGMTRWERFVARVQTDTRAQILLGIGLAIVLFAIGIPLGDTLFKAITHARTFFIENAPFTWILYWAFFVVWVSCFFPFVPLCIAVGFVFGVAEGFFIQTVATFFASLLIFFISRQFLRSWTVKLLSHNPKFARAERAIGEWKNAVKLNFLMCFAPFPFVIHVLMFAVTKTPFWAFGGSFLIGMIPHTLLNLLIGRSLYHFSNHIASDKDSDESKKIDSFEISGLCLAVVGCVSFIVLMMIIVRKEMKKWDEMGSSWEDEGYLVSSGDDRVNNNSIVDNNNNEKKKKKKQRKGRRGGGGGAFRMTEAVEDNDDEEDDGIVVVVRGGDDDDDDNNNNNDDDSDYDDDDDDDLIDAERVSLLTREQVKYDESIQDDY